MTTEFNSKKTNTRDSTTKKTGPYNELGIWNKNRRPIEIDLTRNHEVTQVKILNLLVEIMRVKSSVFSYLY